MSGTTTVVYSGPFESGLELSESLGFGFIAIPHGVPVELPTEIADALCAERPDEFARAKPAKPKTPRKPRKAAAKRAAAPTPDPDPAPADNQEA